MLKDNGWLKDMVLYARRARELADGFDRDSFLADTRTHLAVIHTLVIVGEAAAQVSDPVRAELPGVPWGAIVGMRNKLVHHYFKADLEVVWKTVQVDLEPSSPTSNCTSPPIRLRLVHEQIHNCDVPGPA